MAQSKGKNVVVPSTGPARKMFVGRIPKELTAEVIKAYFLQYGPINEFKWLEDDSGTPKGYCFVTFENEESAQLVYANYDDNKINGEWVDCKPSGSDDGPSQQSGFDPMQLAMMKGMMMQMGKATGMGKNDTMGMVRMMETIADGFSGGHGKGKGKGKPGDWVCPQCGDIVFASKSSCNKCGTEKTMNVKRINMKPGDWTCPGCGDLVFASKHQCSMCGTLKPQDMHLPY